MSKKRFRTPRPTTDTLKLQWGKLPHDYPDICVTWGEGCHKADSRLLMSALCEKTFAPGTFESYPSLVEELKKRETCDFFITTYNIVYPY